MSPALSQTPPRTSPQKPDNASQSATQPSTSSPPHKMSPTLDEIKQTARLAATQIECTIAPDYPRRFRDINAAKEHVKDLCDEAGYDYMLLSRHNLRAGSAHPVVEDVKSRAAFLVAIHAYHDKEFYLDEDMHDKQKLRDAVEAEVTRALSVIKAWPTRFEGAEVASHWAQRVCSQRGVAFTRFEGVPIGKFRGYVGWNTVRKAWEEGKVQLNDVPKGWMRTISTMTDAIETDITRLRQLIRTWPATFPHLNAARNFVQDWCYNHRFRYTGWKNVESRRYGLYVNYGTARQALAAGVFKVAGANPSPTLPRPVIAQGAAEKNEYAAKVAAWMDYSTRNSDSDARQSDGAGSHPELIPDLLVNDIDIERTDSPSPPSSASVGSDDSAPSLSKSAGSENTLIDLDEDVEALQLNEQDKARVDPFKDLITELKRGYFMKPVAEAAVSVEPVTELQDVDIIKLAFD